MHSHMKVKFWVRVLRLLSLRKLRVGRLKNLTTQLRYLKFGKIVGSAILRLRSDDEESYTLLWSDALLFGNLLLSFSRSMLSTSSGSAHDSTQPTTFPCR